MTNLLKQAQVVANVIIQKSRQVRHEVDTSGRLVGYNAYRHERALTFEAYACDILGCMVSSPAMHPAIFLEEIARLLT